MARVSQKKWAKALSEPSSTPPLFQINPCYCFQLISIGFSDTFRLKHLQLVLSVSLEAG